jgi:hypothetical protein
MRKGSLAVADNDPVDIAAFGGFPPIGCNYLFQEK